MNMRVNYGPWICPDEEGKTWWMLDDAHKLVAGWKPLEGDNSQLSPKLTATNNRAVADLRNLTAEFSQGNPPCQTIQYEADPELEASAGVKHLPTRFVDADCYLSWAVSAGYAIPAALRQAMDQKREEEHTKAMYRNRVKEQADRRFGYSDFIRDWQVGKPAQWFGFEVRHDGVYVAVPADDDRLVTAKERADSTWHHEDDLTKPALRFPYTLKELHDFVTAYKLETVIASNEIYGMLAELSMAENKAKIQTCDTKPSIARGVTSEVIIEKFHLGNEWISRLSHRNRGSYRDYLKPPVLVAAGARGKGKGANLWNPAQFALMLGSHKKHKREYNMTRLHTIMEGKFSEWLDEWCEKSGWDDV